jgi:hypothetical protein
MLNGASGGPGVSAASPGTPGVVPFDSHLLMQEHPSTIEHVFTGAGKFHLGSIVTRSGRCSRAAAYVLGGRRRERRALARSLRFWNSQAPRLGRRAPPLWHFGPIVFCRSRFRFGASFRLGAPAICCGPFVLGTLPPLLLLGRDHARAQDFQFREPGSKIVGALFQNSGAIASAHWTPLSPRDSRENYAIENAVARS